MQPSKTRNFWGKQWFGYSAIGQWTWNLQWCCLRITWWCGWRLPWGEDSPASPGIMYRRVATVSRVLLTSFFQLSRPSSQQLWLLYPTHCQTSKHQGTSTRGAGGQVTATRSAHWWSWIRCYVSLGSQHLPLVQEEHTMIQYSRWTWDACRPWSTKPWFNPGCCWRQHWCRLGVCMEIKYEDKTHRLNTVFSSHLIYPLILGTECRV